VAGSLILALAARIALALHQIGVRLIRRLLLGEHLDYSIPIE
jgi:hypothetical protein